MLRYQPRVPVIIGCCCLLGGVFISSFMTSFPAFAVFFGAFFGFGSGFCYLGPILSGWSYFPERKGMVSGIIIGAFGLGAAIFD